MTEPALVDNDVVLKACCYAIGGELIACLASESMYPAVLRVAQYVVRGRIKRSRHLADRDAAGLAFQHLLARLAAVEPDENELQIAAVFESTAQARNLELDPGESQLLAILLHRKLRLMITGDKRAIRAIEEIAGGQFVSPSLACFEQLVTAILRSAELTMLRAKICKEIYVDRAISACFACHSTTTDATSILGGLRSYTNDLRNSAMRVLLASEDLSALVP